MTKIKICGLYTLNDIEIVNAFLPDYIGFILNYPKSHRNISLLQARELKNHLNPNIKVVGVFVNASIEMIRGFCDLGIIDMIQLHGTEDETYIKNLREYTDKEIIKAFIVKTEADVVLATASTADYILLDGGMGNGETFSYDLIKSVGRPFFLAGGLTAETMEGALTATGAFAVDISSGVETNRTKDSNKIECAVKIAHREVDIIMGRFGQHGGQYIPETLMNTVLELEKAYLFYKEDEAFQAELTELYNEYANRPSGLYYSKNMTEDLGGAKIYLKREDLNHTGSHKINNVIGQVLLAKKMGKTRIIAETGAGQHGVATATVATLFGLQCEIFMGQEDIERQALNVYKMKLLGATVHPVTSGTATLKDAVSETMREWTKRIDDTHYVLGSVMGPHPFPTMVRDFQAVISKEIKAQCLEKENRLPDVVIACVGGGSNAIGAFYHFIEDKEVRLIGCEAAGRGIDTDETAATISTGKLGIFHGMKSYFCQDEYGQIAPVYSISAGLDYPGIGPEHSYLHDIGRAEYVAITDDEAVCAFEYLSKIEGIIPAIESAHAIAYGMKLAPTLSKDKIVVINLSGRGDKDCVSVARIKGEMIHE